ncbi:hypothetical protein PaecuDRAFT_3534 [Paenibacillus curdlanolyticus YK9]|uniref:Pyrrolo-quinoline quinone repeat domain-containing protein n=1 Tax=Paenibacillus curdlanolyticus YK9 TaxID=717606 RepID=E0ID32_9BACL|nr:PQQ-binding-like beta-propeller repeat protein [Paenibacillus curdlanolyticus]EFM09487.1 hypothetical protein PaecuDRAFT_3534 [Paenibacillus curdlanolyticus YK9]
MSSKTVLRSFIILSLLFAIGSNLVAAQGTLQQIPPSQFAPLNIKGINQGQFRGTTSFTFTSLSQGTMPKDIYYSPTSKLTYGLGNFEVFKGIDEDALFAFDAAGKQRWKAAIPEEGYQQLIPGQDETLYVYVFPSIMLKATKPNVLYAFDLNGKLKWKYTFPELQQMFSMDAVALKDAFYTKTNDSLVCIQNGAIAWELKLPTLINELDRLQTTIISIDVDRLGNIYLLDRDGWLEKRDAKRQVVWKEKIGTDASLKLVSKDQYILAAQHMKHVYYSVTTGKVVKSPKVDYTDYDRFALPNDRKGGFYAAEKEDSYGLPAGNGIIKFNEKGQVLWHYKIRFSGYAKIRWASLMSDNQGNAYFLDNGGHLYSVDPNGNERFIVLTKAVGSAYLPLYVSQDGVAAASNGDVGTYMIKSVN